MEVPHAIRKSAVLGKVTDAMYKNSTQKKKILLDIAYGFSSLSVHLYVFNQASHNSFSDKIHKLFTKQHFNELLCNSQLPDF